MSITEQAGRCEYADCIAAGLNCEPIFDYWRVAGAKNRVNKLGNLINGRCCGRDELHPILSPMRRQSFHHEFKLPTRPRRLTWRERERLFFAGAPLSLLPALLFLPTLMSLIITPHFRYARLLAAVVFPVFAISAGWGIVMLVRCIRRGEFDLTTALAFGALLVLIVVTVYDAVLLVAVLENRPA